jgi:hypothetical protein
MYRQVNLGSEYVTPSHIVYGKQRSERGLVDMEAEDYKFVREEYDDYPTDISTEASSALRAGLIPEGMAPLGYVLEDTPIYDTEGAVIKENILPAPPTDGTPYTPFYGEKFQSLEYWYNQATFITIDVYKLLFECMQRIRYNGPTTADFFEITNIIGAGYITGVEITHQGQYYLVMYSLNPDAEVNYREQRREAWLTVCRMKFKLFYMAERQPENNNEA